MVAKRAPSDADDIVIKPEDQEKFNRGDFNPQKVSCKLRNGKQLAILFQCLFESVQVKIVNLEFISKAKIMNITALEPNRIAFYKTVFQPKSFLSFDCAKDVMISVGVKTLMKIFEGCEDNEWATINLHHLGPWMLSFEFQKKKDEVCKAWIQSEVYDDEYYSPEGLTKKPWIRTETSVFEKNIKSFAQLNQDIQIKSSSDGVWFCTGEDGLGQGISGQRALLHSKMPEAGKHTFNMDGAMDHICSFPSLFLCKAVIFHDLSDQVYLYPDEDSLTLSYPFHEFNHAKQEKGHIDSIGRLEVRIARRMH